MSSEEYYEQDKSSQNPLNNKQMKGDVKVNITDF